MGLTCFHVVLVMPEIPQNTGAIGRFCVCLDAVLHLIQPLGFSLDNSYVKRAGLDYWDHLKLYVHSDWDDFLDNANPERLFFSSTKGHFSYYNFHFQEGDFLVFGNETRGLPPHFYSTYQDLLYHIPMPGNHARSHNLANSVGIVGYEAYRQIRLQTVAS